MLWDWGLEFWAWSGSEDLFCLVFWCFLYIFLVLFAVSLVFGTRPGGPHCSQPLPRILSCLFFCFLCVFFCFIVTICRFPGFQNLSARLENLTDSRLLPQGCNVSDPSSFCAARLQRPRGHCRLSAPALKRSVCGARQRGTLHI